jgi:peroxiredoxin
MTADRTNGRDQHTPWNRGEAASEVAPAEATDRLHGADRWPSWLLDAVKRRQRAEPPTRADALGTVVLADHEGRSVRLGDLWRDGPAVVVWLRQFGCPFCRSHARHLNLERHRFDALGTSLVLIGQGTPVHAAAFRRMLRIDLPILVDRERVTYLAAGTKLATLDELIGPAVVAKALLAMARRRVILGRNTADEAQLGGSIVVVPGGEVAWSHLSENAADMASADEIFGAVRRVSGV